jgi:hypothetical protein
MILCKLHPPQLQTAPSIEEEDCPYNSYVSFRSYIVYDEFLGKAGMAVILTTRDTFATMIQDIHG